MSTRIDIRVSDERKQDWKKRAKEEKSTLTEFIINKVEEDYSLNDIKIMEGFFDKIVHLRGKVDVNINQISRNINLSRNVHESHMLDFLKVLGEYVSKIEEQNRLIIKVRKDLNSK